MHGNMEPISFRSHFPDISRTSANQSNGPSGSKATRLIDDWSKVHRFYYYYHHHHRHQHHFISSESRPNN